MATAFHHAGEGEREGRGFGLPSSSSWALDAAGSWPAAKGIGARERAPIPAMA